MPFDFKAYDAKCQGLTPEELQREWEHYTRLISGAATSTAVSGIAVPFTLGVSTIGVAMAAPAIHNARKKREIIEKHLNRHNATHVTRKRDVLGSMAVSGTIGVVTLGVGSMGADAIATTGAEHGIQSIVENELAVKVVTHAALDGAGLAVEHAHTGHLKKKDAHKAFQKAGVFQAVQDAKAAEAGYSIAPYDPHAAGAASSSSARPQSMPPPPPYNMATGYQMPPNQTGYQPGQPYVPPGGYAAQGVPQPYNQPPQQPQYHLHPNMTGMSSATAPPYQAAPQSVPGTQVTQSAVPYQQPVYAQPPPGSVLPSYSAPAGAVPGAYDMKAMNEALPAPAPYTYAPPPSILGSSTPQPPAQHYAPPPGHAAQPGEVTPVQQPVIASAGTFQQEPAGHGFPPDYKPHPTPAQPAANQAYPPPPPPQQDYSKRHSIASTIQAPLSPQPNIAAPQPMYSYAPAAAQQPNVAPTPAPPTPYSMPPPPHSQPSAAAPQNTQQQYQYNTAGAYAPLPSPPQNQPPQQQQQQQQQQYEPLACHQNAPQSYQPPPPATNYPPTPISLPNSPPVAQQHQSNMGYFPPPPPGPPPPQQQTACAPQPQQWNAQPPAGMAYTPAATPGAPWQSYGGAPAYPQYQQ